MAEVAIEIADINTVLNANPEFANAVRYAALDRRIEELEAEKAAAPVCDCQETEEMIE